MKKLILVLIIAISFFSCKSNTEKVNEKIYPNLKIYIENEVLQKEEKLDSLTITKIDTLTQKKMYELAWNFGDERLKKIEEMYDADTKVAKAYSNILDLQGKRVDYTAKQYWLKVFDNNRNGLHHLNTLQKIDSLIKISDSVAFVNYGVVVRGKYSNQSNQQNDFKDLLFIVTNDFKVKAPNELFNKVLDKTPKPMLDEEMQKIENYFKN